MAIVDRIKQLTKQLYPTGRAFRMPLGGVFDKLHNALNKSEAKAYSASVSLLDSAIPDNDNFSVDDATDWERRFGLISNPTLSLSIRRLAIKNKMAKTRNIPARQHYLYMQGRLQAAGFNVYVYENRFSDGMGGYITKSPVVFSNEAYPISPYQYGQFQYGQVNYGGTPSNKIANSLSPSIDNSFNIGSSFRCTFFIGGVVPGDWANVDASRETEFRQLILNLKGVHKIGFLLIHYV